MKNIFSKSARIFSIMIIIFILPVIFISCRRNNVVEADKDITKIDSLRMPPNISVKINNEKIGVQLTTYSWNVYNEDGKGYAEYAEGVIKSTDKYYTYEFSAKSKLIIDSEYPPDKTGLSIIDGRKNVEFKYEDGAFILPDEKGIYLLSIACDWKTKGRAFYVFKIKII